MRTHSACDQAQRVYDGRGWRLSPGYDIASFPQVGTERDLAIGVGRNGRRATVQNALTEVASFGLSYAEGASLAEDAAGGESKLGAAVLGKRFQGARNRAFAHLFHRLR
jgi:hypothetical protein